MRQSRCFFDKRGLLFNNVGFLVPANLGVVIVLMVLKDRIRREVYFGKSTGEVELDFTID